MDGEGFLKSLPASQAHRLFLKARGEISPESNAAFKALVPYRGIFILTANTQGHFQVNAKGFQRQAVRAFFPNTLNNFLTKASGKKQTKAWTSKNSQLHLCDSSSPSKAYWKGNKPWALLKTIIILSKWKGLLYDRVSNEQHGMWGTVGYTDQVKHSVFFDKSVKTRGNYQ